MKRIYFCLFLTAALLTLGVYSSGRVEAAARAIDAHLAAAVEGVQAGDTASARRAALAGAQRCGEARRQMGAFLRTEDFASLEASLRAADGYLELGAADEALSELRRAQVQLESLAALARRFL